jgi:hypothetical protein
MISCNNVKCEMCGKGAIERDACYGPIKEELCKLYPDKKQRRRTRVLVPGVCSLLSLLAVFLWLLLLLLHWYRSECSRSNCTAQ